VAAATAGAGVGEAVPPSVPTVFCVVPRSAVTTLAPVPDAGGFDEFALSLPLLVVAVVPGVVELVSLVFVFVPPPVGVVAGSVPVGGAGSAVAGSGAGGVVGVASSAVADGSGAGTAAASRAAASAAAAAASAAAVAAVPVCSACTTMSAAVAVEAAEPTITARSVAIKTRRRVC
jgi:hypothetical protein